MRRRRVLERPDDQFDAVNQRPVEVEEDTVGGGQWGVSSNASPLPLTVHCPLPTAHRSLQKVLERLGAGGVAEFAERLRLDLPDALAGDAELLADFFQRAAVAV